ncbi:MAG: DUF4190 domain-containing protein [Pirellulaceae bacterium]|nr:DUF4190 domain-containing protein [Pirellulaceae bacterium]
MSFDPSPSPNPYQASTAAGPMLSPPPAQNQTAMILAICSLVGGVLGLASCLCCVFLPFPPLSILLGAIALFQKPDQNAKIMAFVGLGLSIATLIVYLILVVLYGAAILSSPEFQAEFS